MTVALTLAAVCGVVGFGVATAALIPPEHRQAAETRRGDLQGLVRTRQADIEDLTAHAAEVRTAIEEALSATGPAEPDPNRALAGGTALRGDGVVVVLDDAAEIPDDPAVAAAHRIVDRDILDVVNALFASGADAVAVNGSRVVATTPIRNAGRVVTVNFRPLSPPFEIIAIGARAGALESTSAWLQLRDWAGLFNLGVTARTARDLEVPAFEGRLRTQAAVPVFSTGGG
ncbi:MAG TPA: DUF881 domain-containing protein [Acidimicrobiales bacterium]